MKANTFTVLCLWFLSIYHLFKNVPQYYTRQVSHQSQKHTSEVQSYLGPRKLQARQLGKTESVPSAFWAHLSQQRISSTSYQWPQGCICSENADLRVMTRPQRCGLEACSLKTEPKQDGRLRECLWSSAWRLICTRKSDTLRVSWPMDLASRYVKDQSPQLFSLSQ